MDELKTEKGKYNNLEKLYSSLKEEIECPFKSFFYLL